jgi:hypothetical protein
VKNGKLILFDIVKNDTIAEIPNFNGNLKTISLNKEKTLCAVLISDANKTNKNKLKIYDIATKKVVSLYDYDKYYYGEAFRFSDNSKYITDGSNIWNIEQNKNIYKRNLSLLSFKGDSCIFIKNKDNIELYNFITHKTKKTIDLQFLNSWDWFPCSNGNNEDMFISAAIYDIADKFKYYSNILLNTESSTSIVLKNTEQRLNACFHHQKPLMAINIDGVTIYDYSHNKLKKIAVLNKDENVRFVQFQGDSLIVVSGNGLFIWDMSGIINQKAIDLGDLYALDAPSNRLAYKKDNSVIIRNLLTNEIENVITPDDSEQINNIFYSKAGKYLFITNIMGKIKVFNRQLKCINTYFSKMNNELYERLINSAKKNNEAYALKNYYAKGITDTINPLNIPEADIKIKHTYGGITKISKIDNENYKFTNECSVTINGFEQSRTTFLYYNTKTNKFTTKLDEVNTGQKYSLRNYNFKYYLIDNEKQDTLLSFAQINKNIDFDYSVDNRYLFVNQHNNNLSIYSVSSAKTVFTIERKGIHYGIGENYFAVSYGNIVEIYSLKTFKRLLKIKDISEKINELQFYKNNLFIVTAEHRLYLKNIDALLTATPKNIDKEIEQSKKDFMLRLKDITLEPDIDQSNSLY